MHISYYSYKEDIYYLLIITLIFTNPNNYLFCAHCLRYFFDKQKYDLHAHTVLQSHKSNRLLAEVSFTQPLLLGIMRTSLIPTSFHFRTMSHT